MKASVFIDGRDATGVGVVPSVMQWIALDVGTDCRRATIRLPIPESEGLQPELEWCRNKLGQLIPKLKSGKPIAPAEVELEDGVSMDAIVKELERAVSTPDGLSASFRGRWT